MFNRSMAAIKAKRMEQLRGKLRQKEKGGPYYYRLTVANGLRKEFALKTCDYEEALQKATELDAVWEAPTKEVAFAQINAIKGFSHQAMNLPLAEGWNKYENHPERAMPHTVSEQIGYQTTYNDFVNFATSPAKKGMKKKTVIFSIAEVDTKICEEYASCLKSKSLSVHTHNRKIKRLRKIFNCLKDYYRGDNPFRSKTLLRSAREELSTVVRRQAFTKEQEQALIAELKNPERKLMNKDEIRIVYLMGMYTGQRMKDCVLMQWQNIDFLHNQIYVHQYKTGKDVTIPIAPALREAFEEARKWQDGPFVCPKTAARYNKINAAGKNVGNNLVNLDVLRVIRWIGLEPSVSVPGRNKKTTVYGFHSLRHSFASFCAQAGVPKAVLLSILGTDSDIADKYYTHVGSEAQLQAIQAISGVMQSVSPQEKLNKIQAVLAEYSEEKTEAMEKIRRILTDL